VAEQQVTAPDQHKPSNRKWARIYGILSIIALLAMLRPTNNHTGWIEDVWLVGTAAVIALMLIGDVVLRRLGLRE
jgi:hypothetical protein